MQNEIITIECFKEPQESDVFVPCPIVWSGDCGRATPLPLITDCMRAGKMHQWCFDWHPTRPLPHLTLRGGGRRGTGNGQQRCHTWMTYPHKTLSKKHTYLLHKKRCTQSEYNFVLLMCIPVKKSHFISPIAHDSRFGNFHRQSIYTFLLINYVLYQYI